MANSKVKGITIEFNGDTTKLDKALRKIKNDARSVDQSLKDVNRALKFNPKNTELLTQKQKLLGQKVYQTSKSLEQLKKVQNQLDEKKVSKNSQEYMRVRREIIEAENKLKHYRNELEKVKNVKLTALTKQLEDVGKKTKAAGDAMTKYVTGPIVAAAGASSVALEGVAGSMAIITKLTGATGEDLEAFRGIFEDMAKTIPADMDAIATAIGEVNTRFGLTGDELQEVSTQFVKFSEINGTDVLTTIDGVQKAMSAYGLSAEETGHVLDVLTKVSQNTGVSVERLYQGIVSNGTAFQEMGLSIEQASILMGQLEKSGVNAETVMQGMRKALKNAAADGVPLQEELARVQDAIMNAETSTEGLQAAYDVFGKSGDQMYAAIKSGTIDLTALADASIDASGAVEKTFAGIQTPAKEVQKALNNLKLLGASIGTTILPYINKGLTALIGFVEKLSKGWQKLGPGTQKVILAIVGAIALVGPALSIAGRIMMAFGTIVSNVGVILGALGKAFAFLTGPVGIAIAAVVAVIAIFRHLWKNSEEFREFWINLWETIKNFVVTTWTTIKNAILNAWNTITGIFRNALIMIKSIWQGVGAFFLGRWHAIKSVFAGVASWFGSIFGSAWSAIKRKFAGWGAFWSGLWSQIKQKFSDIGSAVGDAIHNAITGGLNAVISKIESVINKGVDLINKGIGLINKVKLGKDIGYLNHLNLPRLAQGGVLNGARAVIAGEAGPEAIIPLDKLFRQMDKMAEQITGTGGGVTVNVYATPGMNVEELARAIEQRIIIAQKRRRQAWA